MVFSSAVVDDEHMNALFETEAKRFVDRSSTGRR